MGTLSIADGEQITHAQANEILRNVRQALRPHIKSNNKRATQSFFKAGPEKKKLTIIVKYWVQCNYPLENEKFKYTGEAYPWMTFILLVFY